MTTAVKMSTANAILNVLENCPDYWMAVHEIGATLKSMGHYAAENSIASRMCMELKELVEGRYRAGTRYKEYRLRRTE